MVARIKIISARTEDLDATTRRSIIQVCVAAHQEDDFNSLFTYVSTGGWHFLGYSAEQLVSHAMVTTRWLQPESLSLLKTAYVDAVATLPDYQLQGFGSAVMLQLARDIDSEYDIACLETDKAGFYERLGWQVWRGSLAGRSETGLIPTPEQSGVMILRLSRSPKLDLDSALSIECQSGRIW
jgi:aminoglycoside 2'-N-acetyltransferase I